MFSTGAWRVQPSCLPWRHFCVGEGSIRWPDHTNLQSTLAELPLGAWCQLFQEAGYRLDEVGCSLRFQILLQSALRVNATHPWQGHIMQLESVVVLHLGEAHTYLGTRHAHSLVVCVHCIACRSQLCACVGTCLTTCLTCEARSGCPRTCWYFARNRRRGRRRRPPGRPRSRT